VLLERRGGYGDGRPLRFGKGNGFLLVQNGGRSLAGEKVGGGGVRGLIRCVGRYEARVLELADAHAYLPCGLHEHVRRHLGHHLRVLRTGGRGNGHAGRAGREGLVCVALDHLAGHVRVRLAHHHLVEGGGHELARVVHVHRAGLDLTGREWHRAHLTLGHVRAHHHWAVADHGHAVCEAWRAAFHALRVRLTDWYSNHARRAAHRVAAGVGRIHHAAVGRHGLRHRGRRTRAHRGERLDRHDLVGVGADVAASAHELGGAAVVDTRNAHAVALNAVEARAALEHRAAQLALPAAHASGATAAAAPGRVELRLLRDQLRRARHLGRRFGRGDRHVVVGGRRRLRVGRLRAGALGGRADGAPGGQNRDVHSARH